MTINELMKRLNDQIPFSTQESWDNSGLLIGSDDCKVTKILTALDCTMEVVEEAIENDCNTIIVHHPLIFSGFKSIINQGYGKIIHQLIKHDINLIAMHTNLDAHPNGVSRMMAQQLGFNQTEILLKENVSLNKLQIFVPESHAHILKDALAESGAGQIGDYEHCFFSTTGTGEFKPGENSNPYSGEIGQLHYEKEVKVECVFDPKFRAKIISTIHEVHPYETPAYDIMSFNDSADFGTGVKITLEDDMTIEALAALMKDRLAVNPVRIISKENINIKTIGLIGGSAMDYAEDVLKTGVDVFVTGDIKYHEAHDLRMMGLPAIDIPHYSEYVMRDRLARLIESNMPVEVISSTVDTNPYRVV